MTDHATETTPKVEETKGKKEKPDPRLTGFVFPYNAGKTPFDFVVNPVTGNAKSGGKIWGVSMEDLREGIEGCVIPPLFTWSKGRWLTDIEEKDWPIRDLAVSGSAGEKWEQNVWVVTGEGTPGAWSFRAYLLPTEIASRQTPKHPVMWPKKHKKGKAIKFNGTIHWRWNSSPNDGVKSYEQSYELLEYGFIETKPSPETKPWSTLGPKPTGALVAPSTPAVTTTKSSLPTGVRFRCPGCGHWYTETNLTSHIKSGICPGTDEELDMAVMCDKECGCMTLDEAARVKPGFPRKPKLPKDKELPKEKEEVKPATAEANGSGDAATNKQLTTEEVITPAGGTK